MRAGARRAHPRQPFVEDGGASGPNGWKRQPFVEDGGASGPDGWKRQPFVEDGGASGPNGRPPLFAERQWRQHEREGPGGKRLPLAPAVVTEDRAAGRGCTATKLREPCGVPLAERFALRTGRGGCRRHPGRTVRR
jgi:hypothetical protein